MSKMLVVGVSASAPGSVSKAGKAYSIGQVHTMAPLAPPRAEGGIEKGAQGVSYRCDPEVVRRIGHLPFPLTCDVELEVQMVFGKPETSCLDVRPVQVEKKAA